MYPKNVQHFSLSNTVQHRNIPSFSLISHLPCFQNLIQKRARHAKKKSTQQKQPQPIHLRFTEAYLVKIKFLRYIKILLDCPGQSALDDPLGEDAKNLHYYNETLHSEARFSSNLMKD